MRVAAVAPHARLLLLERLLDVPLRNRPGHRSRGGPTPEPPRARRLLRRLAVRAARAAALALLLLLVVLQRHEPAREAERLPVQRRLHLQTQRRERRALPPRRARRVTPCPYAPPPRAPRSRPRRGRPQVASTAPLLLPLAVSLLYTPSLSPRRAGALWRSSTAARGRTSLRSGSASGSRSPSARNRAIVASRRTCAAPAAAPRSTRAARGPRRRPRGAASRAAGGAARAAAPARGRS